ncbi:MAG: polysaccharide biosynthesis protein [Gammaproteobacteria bacterium]|nr:polysaccharide biosynthesis protein [Gammaproteobacteria bacterium]
MITTINWFLDSPRPIKRATTVLFDLVCITFCIGLASSVLEDKTFSWTTNDTVISFLTAVLSIVAFVKLGFYRAILRYIGTTTVSVLLIGVSISAFIFSSLHLLVNDKFVLTQTMFYWSFLTLSIGGSRLALKAYIQQMNKGVSRVAIYGVGAAGRQLASALGHGDKYKPVAFFDDDSSLHGAEVDGLKVFASEIAEDIIAKYRLSHVFLAMPSVAPSRKNEILRMLEPFPVRIKTIAGMEDIVSGKVKIEELKDLDIEDLLGRDAVTPDSDLLSSCITNKTVMVTGAGGSIGSELCRQIVILKPKTLLLYELSEFGLYAIERELKAFIADQKLNTNLIPLLGSVQHRKRLTRCMQYFGVNTVYHAAAYKHVPIVEHNVIEGIRNNVFGTYHAARAASDAKVDKFVLISTDKAVRPTNIMGASKRLAELLLQALSEKTSDTIFTMVRFGNVLGSSGSVVPLFREQIKRGGPVTVTHPDITRYFMTIPEAAQLVIQAGAMGQGGDVFVLDMGEPVKIASLAERMIHLMGRTVKSQNNESRDIEIQYSGLRPGEKLFEELLIGENVEGTEHPRIMRAREEFLSWPETKKALDLLDDLCESMDCDGIVQLLLRLPTGYNPQHAVCDLLWEQSEDHFFDSAKVVRFKTLS